MVNLDLFESATLTVYKIKTEQKVVVIHGTPRQVLGFQAGWLSSQSSEDNLKYLMDTVYTPIPWVMPTNEERKES